MCGDLATPVCHVATESLLLMTVMTGKSNSSLCKLYEGMKPEHYKSAAFISELNKQFLNFPVDTTGLKKLQLLP